MSANVKVYGLTAVLFILSILSYWQTTREGERFTKGQKFLPNLNPDEIHEIVINKAGEVTQLKKLEDAYVVASVHDYPAKNESVNRFLNDILDLSLDKEVGSLDKFEDTLGLTEGSGDATVLSLKNSNGKEMVQFVIGKSLEGGSGNYVVRKGDDPGPVYLTDKTLFLSTDAGSFLDKEILNVAQTDIQNIQGNDFLFEQKDEKLLLTDVPSAKQEKASETGKVKSMLTSLSFEEVFVADDQNVAGLPFKEKYVFELKDDTGYRVSVATQDEKTFVKLEGFHKIKPFTVDPNESEEEIKAKSERWKRAEEIQEFNTFHGSWVYQLSDYVGKKFILDFKDLIEDKKTDS